MNTFKDISAITAVLFITVFASAHAQGPGQPQPSVKPNLGIPEPWTLFYWEDGPGPASAGDQCFSGDFNGDGRTDIACYTLKDGEWRLGLAPSSGNRWISRRWVGGPGPVLARGQCVSGDFNGDGRTDIACYTLRGGEWHLGLAPASGNRWVSQRWDGGPGPGSVGEQCLSGDFNGDGRTGIACYTLQGGEWHLGLAPTSGNRWISQRWEGGPGPASAREQCLAGDFNGDGQTDIACYTLHNGEWHLGLAPASGNHWVSRRWQGGPGPTSVRDQCLAGDFNGDGKDGRTDIACYTLSGGQAVFKGTWHLGLAPVSGNRWTSRRWSGGPAPESVGNQCFSVDFNNDGQGDIACYTLERGRWYMAQSIPFWKVNYCENYAERAVFDYKESLEYNCHFTGPLWSPDFKYHYDWCMRIEDLKLANDDDYTRGWDLNRCKPKPPPPEVPEIFSFSRQPDHSFYDLGEAVELVWEVTCPSNCQVSLLGGVNGSLFTESELPRSGSHTVLSKRQDTVYELRVTGSGRTISKKTSIRTKRSQQQNPASAGVFFFKMTGNSWTKPCFTTAARAENSEKAKALAERLNGGYKAEQISYAEYIKGC